MKKLILTLVLVALARLCAAAQTPNGYKFDAVARVGRSKTDTYYLNSLALGTSLYFGQVEAKKGPLAETAFIERKGYAAFYAEKGFGKSSAADANPDADVVASNLYINVKAAKPKSPLFFSFGLVSLNNAYDVDGTDTDTDAEKTLNKISAELGYFITDGAAISAFTSYSRRRFNGYGINFSDLLLTVRSNGAKVKWVVPLNESAANIEAGGKFAKFEVENGNDEDSNIIFFLGGDIYFTRRMSLGGEVEINTGDFKADEGKTYALRAEYFISPKTALSLDANMFRPDNDDINDDVSTGWLSLLFRF